ncbi:hypothetical protein QUF90_21080 [Desulfococcaceae bacterium HSG9]|nr:hypothetical protein [Desulfococcaceae bacterium HSG9]
MIFLKGAVSNVIIKFSILSILLLILSGCAINAKLLGEVQDTVQQSKELLRAVEELKIETKYPELYAEAKKEFKQAEELMQAGKSIFKKKALNAQLAAKKSINASQKILKQYYFDEIMPKAKALIQKIKEKVGQDTDNPLNENIPELQAILDYGKDLENEKIKNLINRVVGSDNKIKEKESIIKSFVIEKFKSEELKINVLFKLGDYILSEDGINLLNKELVQKIIINIDNYKRKYQSSTMVIKMEVKGFADRVGVNEKKPLFIELKKNNKDLLPPSNQPEKRRKFLNQLLSKLRAKSIVNYISQQISDSETDNTKIKIEQKSIGMGEAIPAGVKPLKSTRDPNRRICKIYCYISYISQ